MNISPLPITVVRDIITEFPHSPPAGGAFIIYFGRSPSVRPRLCVMLLSFPYGI